jgi:anthranilate phosphoribosyltransferase
LGINLALTPDQVAWRILEVGIGFLVASQLHGAMRYAICPRREIGIRTIFTVLGLPDQPGGKSAFWVFGEGSFDEISIVGPPRVSHLKDGMLRTYNIAPEDFGLKGATLADIKGGDVTDNLK